MHDGGGNRSQTVAALPTILKTLKARGYGFRTLPARTIASTRRYDVGDGLDDPRGTVREAVDLVFAGGAGEHQHGARPASRPLMMSVSIRSPIITVVSECASIRFSALRIISGLGLPTKYGATPVARVISAATEPVAGSGPSATGRSGRGWSRGTARRRRSAGSPS